MLGNSNNNTVRLLKLLKAVHVNVVIKSVFINICSSDIQIGYGPCVVPFVARMVSEC